MFKVHELPNVAFGEAEIETFIHSSITYLEQYKTLMDLGASVRTVDQARALALAVYGWMPKILRSFEFSDGQLALVRQVSNNDEAVKIIRQLPGQSKKPPVNQSWVGTSKFLHFLKPDCFPIWDSHIARSFGLIHWYQYESAATYENYLVTMNKLLPLAVDSTSQVIGRIKIQFGYEVTSLRALEFLIFAESRARATPAQRAVGAM